MVNTRGQEPQLLPSVFSTSLCERAFRKNELLICVNDSFIQYMADINYRELEKHILSASGKQDLDEKTAMLIRTYCLGTVCLSCEWILGKYRATPEELAEVYKTALPPTLRELVTTGK